MINRERLLHETFLRELVWLDEVDSTNSQALRWSPARSDLPLLIGAEHQCAGRGRGKNAWWAGSGAVTCSLVLEPQNWSIETAQWPLLSLTVGLAVCRALEEQLRDAEVRLKWPNDVLVQGRKICGILIETVPDCPGRLVVGIGLNVNNSLADAPAEIRETAISLAELTGHSHDRTQLLLNVLTLLDEEFAALGQRDPELLPRCRHRCYLTGRMVTIRDVTSQSTGMCLGLDDDGALQLMTESGPRRFLAGVITSIV